MKTHIHALNQDIIITWSWKEYVQGLLYPFGFAWLICFVETWRHSWPFPSPAVINWSTLHLPAAYVSQILLHAGSRSNVTANQIQSIRFSHNALYFSNWKCPHLQSHLLMIYTDLVIENVTIFTVPHEMNLSSDLLQMKLTCLMFICVVWCWCSCFNDRMKRNIFCCAAHTHA